MKRKGDWGFLLFVSACAAVMLLSALHARADEESLWLTTGMWSRHNNDVAHDEWDTAGVTHPKYRDNNTGIGLQYSYTASDSIAVGMYQNSINKHSNYAVYAWQPLHAGCWKAGLMGGVATGYTENAPFIPIGATMLSCDGDLLGFNLTWLPSVVVAIQLKIKVW